MEIFGIFIPLWVILTTYFIGMFIIGYPMGYFSIKVWKYYSDGYSLLRNLLFPIASKDKKITNIDDASDFTEAFQLGKALKNNDDFALMRYVIWTMLLWPIRFLYLLSFHTLTLLWYAIVFIVKHILCPLLNAVGWILNTIVNHSAKGFLVCKKCEI